MDKYGHALDQDPPSQLGNEIQDFNREFHTSYHFILNLLDLQYCRYIIA